MAARPSFTRPILLRILALSSALALVLLAAGSALAKNGPPGFLTKQPAMLTAITPGGSVLPIITVPESPKGKGDWQFEAIPDGIGFGTSGKKDVTIYVNHETSTVPFPYNQNNPNPENSQNDFDNAQLSAIKWVRDFYDASAAHAEEGGYINFMSDDDQARIKANYRGNYERLVEIKRKYDPGNLFHLNQNIKP